MRDKSADTQSCEGEKARNEDEEDEEDDDLEEGGMRDGTKCERNA